MHRALQIGVSVSLGVHLLAAMALSAQPHSTALPAAPSLRMTLSGATSTPPVPKRVRHAPSPLTSGPISALADDVLEPIPSVPDPPHGAYADPDDTDQPASVATVGELPVPGPEIENGGVILVVYVNELGKPEFIEIEGNTLPVDFLSEVVATFRNAEFSPALIGGKPTRSWRRIEILVNESLESQAAG